MDPQVAECFSQLSQDELKEWAGKKIYERGVSYSMDGRVSNLRTTPTGISATVSGEEDYVSELVVSKRGHTWRLASSCTCPYEFTPCKHAVAVALECMHFVANDREIPDVLDDGPYLSSDDIDVPPVRVPVGSKPTPTQPPSRRPSSTDLKSFLQDLPHETLLSLVLDWNRRIPEIRKELKSLLIGQETTPAKISQSLRNEIEQQLSPTRRRRQPPDLSTVAAGLKRLLESGLPEGVLDFCKLIRQRASEFPSASSDWEWFLDEVNATLELEREALERVHWPLVTKLLWALDARFQSEAFAESAFDFLVDFDDTAAWSQVADTLRKRLSSPDLEAMAPEKRRHMSEVLIDALAKAGRIDESLQLEQDYASHPEDWAELAGRFIGLKRWDDAALALDQGLKSADPEDRRAVDALQVLQLEIHRHRGDDKAIEEHHWREFLDRPTIAQMHVLTATARTKGQEEALRQRAMRYFETGEGGPLARDRQFPMYDQLVRLALLQRNTDELVRLLDSANKDRRPINATPNELAEALSQKYPDRALAIWRLEVERTLTHASARSYEHAAKLLDSMRPIAKKTGKLSEWRQFVDDLMKQHRRKQRLMEELNGVLRRAR